MAVIGGSPRRQVGKNGGARAEYTAAHDAGKEFGFDDAGA
jgi:hypothetical protein